MAAEPEKVQGHRPEDDVEMTFMEHLVELRTRLIRALIGIVPGTAVAWVFKEKLLELMAAPWRDAYQAMNLGEPQLHFANPIDPFVSYLMMCGIAGLIISSPWVFWQIWGFIAPGLYRREKRLAFPFVLVSTVFFVGGVAFGYEIVLSFAFQAFLDFGGPVGEHLVIQPTVMLGEYLSFATRLLLAFGVTFEIPVVITFLSFAGLVNWRQLLKFARWWLLISGVLAALLTPPDVGSQMMMLIPLNVLYWMSIGLAALFGPKPPPPPGTVSEDGFER